jgi:PAS domain S-box-containing protein
VLKTGQPIRFERELVATGRFLELAAFRVEPASRREVAVLFKDVTARKRTERALQELNETLEARVAAALAERKVLADIVEGTNAFVQVVDLDLRWLAVNGAATREFRRMFGVTPRVGARVTDVLADQPQEREALRRSWLRALGGEDFSEVVAFGAEGDRRHYETHMSMLYDATGNRIGAYQFAYDVTERLGEQERLRKAEEALR